MALNRFTGFFTLLKFFERRNSREQCFTDSQQKAYEISGPAKQSLVVDSNDSRKYPIADLNIQNIKFQLTETTGGDRVRLAPLPSGEERRTAGCPLCH